MSARSEHYANIRATEESFASLHMAFSFSQEELGVLLYALDALGRITERHDSGVHKLKLNAEWRDLEEAFASLPPQSIKRMGGIVEHYLKFFDGGGLWGSLKDFVELTEDWHPEWGLFQKG